MLRRISVLSAVTIFMIMLTGQAHAALPPIEVIKKVPPKPGVFKDASQTKPIVIRSEKDAAEYFSDLSVALLNKKVDFKQQIVLVFAWRGSGQDRLTYTVAESFPEQISFIYLPGRTRDLRPHIKIYVLRSNVKWTGPKPNGGPGNTASKPKQITCTVGELKREALVYLPVKKIDNAVPLVFGFHGHGGSSRNAARSFKIHQLWPEAIVVYMQGLPTVGKLTDPKGRRSGWEHSPEQYKGRDLKFFDAILKRLQTDYKIDNQRIYATGHSNGGGFTYLLWAHRPDVFAAIAPSAAASRSLITAKPKPVAVMHLAGRNDRLVRFTWQQLAMKRVRAINGCSDKGSDWAKGCTIYASETNNNAPFVSFIHSGRHRYPTQGPALIVRFFKAHTRKPTTKTEETKNKTD